MCLGWNYRGMRLRWKSPHLQFACSYVHTCPHWPQPLLRLSVYLCVYLSTLESLLIPNLSICLRFYFVVLELFSSSSLFRVCRNLRTVGLRVAVLRHYLDLHAVGRSCLRSTFFSGELACLGSRKEHTPFCCWESSILPHKPSKLLREKALRTRHSNR